MFPVSVRASVCAVSDPGYTQAGGGWAPRSPPACNLPAPAIDAGIGINGGSAQNPSRVPQAARGVALDGSEMPASNGLSMSQEHIHFSHGLDSGSDAMEASVPMGRHTGRRVVIPVEQMVAEAGHLPGAPCPCSLPEELFDIAEGAEHSDAAGRDNDIDFDESVG